MHPRRAPIEHAVPAAVDPRRLLRHRRRHPQRRDGIRIHAGEAARARRRSRSSDSCRAGRAGRSRLARRRAASARTGGRSPTTGLPPICRSSDGSIRRPRAGLTPSTGKYEPDTISTRTGSRCLAGREVDGRRMPAEHAVEEPRLLLQIAAERIRHHVAESIRGGEHAAVPVDLHEAIRARGPAAGAAGLDRPARRWPRCRRCRGRARGWRWR